MVDGGNNWETQQQEMESLGYIYPEEIHIISEQPYKFDVLINSNTESEDKNFLKMKIHFDLQLSYPDCVPYFRLKNLSPDYMDNNFLDRCETLMRQHAEENLGNMMIFELCDLVKTLMTDINDEVLSRLEAHEESQKVEHALKQQETSKHLTYTPVNAETFKVWCDQYKERVRIEREAFKSV